MTQGSRTTASAGPKRLAAALKENLRRRKAQARGRAADEAAAEARQSRARRLTTAASHRNRCEFPAFSPAHPTFAAFRP